MLEIPFSFSGSLVLCTALAVVGCSSSDSPAGGAAGSAAVSNGGQSASGGASAGTSSGGASAGTSSGGASAGSGGKSSGGASGGGASGGGASAGSGGAAPTGPSACAYSISGDLNDPTTNAPYGCANGHVQQSGGSGDFIASISGAFKDAAGNTPTFACSLSSAKAPNPGDAWVMSKETHSQGNCELNNIKNGTATIWAASSSDASLIGAVTITFKSASITHGVNRPQDVYYFYDVTVTATLKGQTAGATDVTVTGTFKNNALPLGA